MRKRSEEILRLLIKEKRGVSVFSLKKKYQVTERTLRNDLGEINEFLRRQRISDIYFDQEGNLRTGPDFDRDLVDRELTKLNMYFYKMSPKERQLYLKIQLLWDQRYLVMKNIGEELGVSRITVLSDFETVREELEREGIEVLADSGKGVLARCPQKLRMAMLLRLLRSLTLEVENEGFFQRFVLENLYIEYTFHEIYTYAQEYLSIHGLVFVAEVLYELVLYLFVSFNLLGEREKDCPQEEARDENDGLLFYVGNKLGCSVSGEQRELFEEYLKEKDISLYVKNLDEVEFYEVILHFLANIDEEVGLQLCQDKLLIESLVLHIKNMKDWGELDLEFSELDQVFWDYRSILASVEKNLYVLEKYLSYELNENMKKSIMIHICAAMLRNSQKAQKPCVVLACPGSMATGRYLETQIKNYFDFRIKGVFSAGRLSKELEALGPVDFVISTVQIRELPAKCLKVHTTLTMQDITLIQKTAFSCRGQAGDEAGRTEKRQKMVSGLRELQRDEELPKRLYEKIERLILEYENEQPELERTAIGELLEPDSLIFEDSTEDWEKGIRRSAAVLLKKGAIGPGFVEKAIQNVKDYGDYIILGSGVALAHAGKDCEVYRDGLSLLVSHQGILFTGSQRRVYFLFCFSSLGEKDYIQLFQEIVEIGQNKERREALLKGEKQEVYQQLCFKET